MGIKALNLNLNWGYAPQFSRKILMKNAIIALFIVTFYSASFADDLSNRVKVGMSKSEIVSVFGENPDGEDCTAILTVSKCSLIWKKGLISKTTYTVTTVADRVVAVSVQSGKILGL